MGNPLLAITDGTTRVNLFGKSGFRLVDWRPAQPEYKDGGVWQTSPFSRGRQLVAADLSNITDTITLAVTGASMDFVIQSTQELKRLLQKAVEYWTTRWQNTPVWIEARGDCETNTRYALIHSWKIPDEGNPYDKPFGGNAIKPVMDNFVLTLEHSLWMANAPGTGTATPISGGNCWQWPSYLIFNGTTSILNCASDAGIDNLADAALTAEAWVYALGYGEGNQGRIFEKTAGGATGWYFNIDSALGLVGTVYCAATNGVTSSVLANFALNQWNHVAMTWDDAADRRIRLWVNGIQQSNAIVAGAGAIVVDAANDLIIGNRSASDFTFNGYIGWSRISNNIRYAGNFAPPPRCSLPDIDANTLGQWIKEGTGTAVDNMQGTAARDGVAANCTWGADCC